jgi:ADP-ribose pyrophosphatase YjhB (NUDIX family)
MIKLSPPPFGSWRAKALNRAIHFYFGLTRSMTMGVRAACFDEAGRLFLVRHSYITGWHMPGGGVERHETVEQALEKELREEGNLTMTDRPQLFQVYLNKLVSNRDHIAFYRVGVLQSAPRKPDREIVECGFFALDELPPGTSQATHSRLKEIRGETPPAQYW